MQQSEAVQQQLRATYLRNVANAFARARRCLAHARAARRAGDTTEMRTLIRRARTLRTTAAEWRARAQALVCFIWCLSGCGPSPDFKVAFHTHRADDDSVTWWLAFQTERDYRDLLKQPDGQQTVDELITQGLKLHDVRNCRPVQVTIAKTKSGGVDVIGACEFQAPVSRTGI